MIILGCAINRSQSVKGLLSYKPKREENVASEKAK
jgi:hypothetical protein